MSVTPAISFVPATALALLQLFIAACSASDSEERQKQTGTAVERSSDRVPARKNGEIARWHDMLEIAREKDPANKPLLIKALRNESHLLRGAAAWGLSQLGGKDAQDALLEYLRRSIADRSWADIARATEAQDELPDKRALDLLMECLDVAKKEGKSHYVARYAAEALGKIGNPNASLVIAQQLDLNIDYTMSRDGLYLAAIRDTKGEAATPILIDYLNRLVAKMTGQQLREPMFGVPSFHEGPGVQQMHHNFEVYARTLSALESVTGSKSPEGSREEVAKQWSQWWDKFESVRKRVWNG